MSERTSRNGSARVAPGAEARAVAAPAAPSAESAAERAWLAELRHISDLCLQLGHAVAGLVENLERDLAARAETSLMSTDVKPTVIEPAMPELLTPKQVAEMLQLHERTVRTRVRSGKLPEPIKIGRSIRWRRKTIENWIAEQEDAG